MTDDSPHRPEQGVPKSGEGFIDFIGQVVYFIIIIICRYYHYYNGNILYLSPGAQDQGTVWPRGSDLRPLQVCHHHIYLVFSLYIGNFVIAFCPWKWLITGVVFEERASYCWSSFSCGKHPLNHLRNTISNPTLHSGEAKITPDSPSPSPSSSTTSSPSTSSPSTTPS